MIEVDTTELDRLIAGAHPDPHGILGPHESGDDTTVRVLKPLADSVTVVTPTERVALRHEYGGVWAGELSSAGAYHLEVAYAGLPARTMEDPYRFGSRLGEVDLHLIGEGRHEELWKILGAHVQEASEPGEVSGTSFAVWAPSARGVRVKGDFNDWDGREHPMRRIGESGVWELFVPGIGDGERYKYAVLGADGDWRDKADPLAFRTEEPPATSSVVFTSRHLWRDEQWMNTRTRRPDLAPMSVYEVHPASWRRHEDGSSLSYDELAEELTAYVVSAGFTHVEFLPVMEHPFGGSWGYQVSSYYAPTARLGDPDGLRRLIDALHRADIGVILDWVPAHFPKDDFALARFDGAALYEDPNPLRGEHPDWGTYVFDFGRRQVRNFLVANALFWLTEFHVDAIRVDAVASMLYLDYSRQDGHWQPNVHGGRENLEAVQFLQELNGTVYRAVPGAFTIAEESTSWPGVTAPTSAGGLGFGFKWNMGWMHDSLQYLARDPIHRSYHHGELTNSLNYAFSENYVLPISHDEVVHGKGSLLRKMPGDRWRQLAGVRAFLGYMWAHPGKQLLFMGCEFAQEAEWAEQRQLDWWLLDQADHRGVRDLVVDLNTVYRAERALWQQDATADGFNWLLHDGARSRDSNTIAFARWSDDGVPLVCVSNFSAMPHEGFPLVLPQPGPWQELINTDASVYGGSGVGNLGTVTADADGSASVRVPPLGTLWLRPADSAG